MTPREAPRLPPIVDAGSNPAPRPRRVIASDALFGERREVVIVHGAEEYRLRITKAGKLILTK